MSKQIQIICAVLFFTGVILGPGYLTYAWYFSGNEVQQIPVHPEKQTKHDLSLKLKPSMNPIIVELHGFFAPTSAAVKSEGMVNRYYVQLNGNTKNIMRTIHLGWMPDNRTKSKSTGWDLSLSGLFSDDSRTSSRKEELISASDPIRLDREGRFNMNVDSDPDKQEIPMENLMLEVRSGVLIPDPEIYWLGFILIIASLFLSITVLEIDYQNISDEPTK